MYLPFLPCAIITIFSRCLLPAERGAFLSADCLLRVPPDVDGTHSGSRPAHCPHLPSPSSPLHLPSSGSRMGVAKSILTGLCSLSAGFLCGSSFFHMQAIKMSESLMKRTPLPDDIQVPESNITDPLTKEEEAFRRVCRGGRKGV